MLFDTRYLTAGEAEKLREQALCRLRDDLQAERSRSLVASPEGRKTPQEDICGRWWVSVPSAKP